MILKCVACRGRNRLRGRKKRTDCDTILPLVIEAIMSQRCQKEEITAT